MEEEYEAEVKQLKQQLVEKVKQNEVLETALQIACEDLQNSDSAYINAKEYMKGNKIVLPVENAMQIEYEQALNRLGYVVENMPEKYNKHNFKSVLEQSFAKDKIELLENLKDFVRRQLMITTINSSDLDEAEAKGCNEVIKDIEEKIDCLICLTKL